MFVVYVCVCVCVCRGDRLGVDEGRLLDYLGKLLRGPIRQELTLLLFKMAVINIYAIHHALDASMGGWRNEVGGAAQVDGKLR